MNEPYSIRVSPRAEPDLQRLAEKIATACVEFVFGPRAPNPRRVGKPLRTELDGPCSARRGDDRVIDGVVESAHTVEVVHIDRRSDVCRR